MDWGKSILSGLKYFVIALLGVLAAALLSATTSYSPSNPLEIVFWKYAILPLIVAMVGWINNIRKHIND